MAYSEERTKTAKVWVILLIALLLFSLIAVGFFVSRVSASTKQQVSQLSAEDERMCDAVVANTLSRL